MKAISIRQPWAWLILNAGKDIENRGWKTSFRGHVLIHASKGMTRGEYEDAETSSLLSHVAGGGRGEIALPKFEELERGGIVGSAEIVDCVDASESPWFFGPFGFVMANPKTLPFQPMKGNLGLFDVPICTWRCMIDAPHDGTEVELLVRHHNYRYCKNDAERGRWEQIVRSRWIDHNGGGWSWFGIAGSVYGWRPCGENFS